MKDYKMKATEKEICPYCNSAKVEKKRVKGGLVAEDSSLSPMSEVYKCLECNKDSHKQLK